MRTILTAAMIVAMGAAPAVAQSSTTSAPPHTDSATAPNGSGGVAGLDSPASAMSKKAAENPAGSEMQRPSQEQKAKTGPSTSASPGVDHTAPKGTPSSASHTPPE